MYRRRVSKNSFDFRSTDWWMNTQLSTTEATRSGDSKVFAASAKKVLATELSASSGHSLNQSMVQQLTREGNMRMRCLNSSLTGLIASTQCRLIEPW